MSRYFKDTLIVYSEETEETLQIENQKDFHQMYIGSNWPDEALLLLRNVLEQSVSVINVSDEMFTFSMIMDEVFPVEEAREADFFYRHNGDGYYYYGWGVELSKHLTVPGLVQTFSNIGNLILTIARNKLIKDTSLVVHIAKNDNFSAFVKLNYQMKEESICYFVSSCVSGLLKMSVSAMDIYKVFLKKNFPNELFRIKSDAFWKLKSYSDWKDRYTPMEYDDVFEIPSVKYVALMNLKKVFQLLAKEYMVPQEYYMRSISFDEIPSDFNAHTCVFSSETPNEDTVLICEVAFSEGSFYAAYDDESTRLMLIEKKPRILSYSKYPQIQKEVQMLCSITVNYSNKEQKEFQKDVLKTFLIDAALKEELAKNLIGKMFSS